MVDLKDLKALRAAMTQGEWKRRPWPEFGVDGPDYPICTVNSDDDRRPLLNEDKAKCDSEDVDGIVATHNAADCLIEIAESMLFRQQAEMFLQEVRLAWQASSDDDALRAARIKRDEADIRWRAALAKIKP